MNLPNPIHSKILLWTEWKPYIPYHACAGEMAAAPGDKQERRMAKEHFRPGISQADADAEDDNTSTGKTRRCDISSAYGLGAVSYVLLTCGFVHEEFEGHEGAMFCKEGGDWKRAFTVVFALWEIEIDPISAFVIVSMALLKRRVYYALPFHEP